MTVLDGGAAHCPAFAIEDDVGITSLNGGDDLVDGLNINQTGQVKTEAVDVVLLYPVEDGVHDVVSGHGALGGEVVADTGAVGPVVLAPEAGEIVGNDLVVAEVTTVIGVVVNHVHDHIDALGVEGLNHLLHFGNTDLTVVGIGGKGAFRNIEVLGIVAPGILLPVGQVVLVHTGMVVNRHQLNVGNTQLLDVIQCGGTAQIISTLLGQAQVLASPRFLNTGGGVDGHLTNVHLVDDGVGVVHALVGAQVLVPALRIIGIHVDDHAAVTVGTGGLGIGVRSLGGVTGEVHQVVVVSAVQITADGNRIDTLFSQRHGCGGDPVITAMVATTVQNDADTGGRGSPNLKGSGLLAPGGAQIVAIVGVVIGKTTGIEQTIGLDVHNRAALDHQIMNLNERGLAAQDQGIAIAIHGHTGDSDAGGAAIALDNGEGLGEITGYRQRSLNPDVTRIVIQVCIGRLTHLDDVIAVNNGAGGTAGVQEEVDSTGLDVGNVN